MKQKASQEDEIYWFVRWLIVAALVYLLLAYIVAPAVWRHYEHNPALADAPKTTTTPAHIPGDPLNIGFTGTEAEVLHAFLAANWQPADPITLRSSLGIARSVLFQRPDPTAPVSTLLLYGRRQDVVFERATGQSARQRHHVRLWRSPTSAGDGRPTWLGAATFDQGVGLSHLTGQITHHIAPNIDAERDGVIADLQAIHQLTQVYQVTGVGPTVAGRNGGGDWYYTDGEVTIGVLPADNAPHTQVAEHLPNPAAVSLKNRVWRWLRHRLQRNSAQLQR